MSSRRVDDPRQHEFDSALRNALHTAMESVEPGADGLDQIRTKIAARRSARRKLAWRTAAAQNAHGSWWRSFVPARDWLPAVVGAVVERFRPDPNRAGWFGWLRPAAAVTTGLFVLTAASWAAAALPGVINPHGSTTMSSSSPKPLHHRTSASVLPNSSGSGIAGATQPGHGSPNPSSTATCTSGATSPNGSPTSSGSPSQTGSPTPSGSTSPSTSPSTSASQTTPPTSPSVGGGTPGSSASAGSGAAPVPTTSPDATAEALQSMQALYSAALAAVAPYPAGTPTSSPTISGPGSPSPTSSAPATPCP